MPKPTLQRRYPLGASEADRVEQDVDDALAATLEERMAAAVTLLETAYRLWQSQGLADDKGLCRFPGCAQQRRRGVRRHRRDGGHRARPVSDDA